MGVLGCGLVGSGIAQVCTQSGYHVAVSEINDALLNKGMASINSRLVGYVEKGKLSVKDNDSTLSRIEGTTSTRDLSDLDLIIKVIIENMDLKKKIFAELDKICPQAAVLAKSTSVLSVIDIATETNSYRQG